MQYVCGQMSRAALYKEPVSRLPAAASCLGRHAHPAGRSPNSSSLFLPLAAVVAVAQGLFYPPDYSAGRCCSNPPLQPLFKADKTETPVPGSDTGVLGGRGWIAQAAHLKKPRRGFFTRRTIRRVDAVRIHPCSPFSRQIKQKLQYPVRILESLVGAGGFEPPKLKAADLQSVPIGHSGTRPYLFLQSYGLPVYVTTESAICQPIIWAGRKKRRNKGRDHKSPPARVRFTASGREGFSA